MEKSLPLDNEDSKVEIKRKFFEEEGSSRAITSGSLSMIFALVGSMCVWLFLIIATGWDGLQYFGLTTAINSIVGIFSIGFARNFIAEIKEAFVINEELGKIKAAAFSKIFLLTGYSIGTSLIILSLFTPNELLRICYLGSGVWTFFGYTQTVLGISLEIQNRYDIIAFLSLFGGIFLLFWASLFINLNWNPIFFAFHPFFNIPTFCLFIYFFYKKAPYSFGKILSSKLTSKKLKEAAPEEVRDLLREDEVSFYLKNSAFSMITNLESHGIYGNLLIYFAALYLALFDPKFQSLGVSLLTILMIYGAVKTVILYYSAPLNIEVAEACTKECHEIIEESVNNSTRISSMLALAFVVGMIALSADLLLLLHEGFFIESGSFDQDLFLLAQTLFILIIIGQFAYGYSTLFGNALIGSGNARYAAIGFGGTLIILAIASPICIYLWSILGIGVAMIISIIFLLPYMLIQLKRKLGIDLNFKLGRMIPNLILLFMIFYFFPIDGLLGLTLKLIIGALVYMIMNPFWGVSVPEDLKMIKDLCETIKIKPVGKFISRLMQFSYNLSPFNQDKILLEQLQ
ncbi:MAG: polysaccharide biosynthesis protein [Promethearchaeota archaeon]|nr:MAG: polysaccharide biosynthesis protein [Candidatus Lokiarchaeota archaeon]